MPVYPQLGTGASTHYPATKLQAARTVVNVAGDERTVKLHDEDGGLVHWRLSYSGLSETERAALETFFQQAEGRLKSFLLVDPVGNLLAWSEVLTNAVWEKSPLLSLDTGVADPLGTTRATRLRNTGTAVQTIQQTLAAPGEYICCWSLYARAASPVTATMYRGARRQSFTIGAAWARISLAGPGPGTEETVAFGIELPASAAVEVFGLQVEGQIGASGYRRTTAKSGIYPDARFQDDSIRFIADGVNRHSCLVNIIHANHL